MQSNQSSQLQKDAGAAPISEADLMKELMAAMQPEKAEEEQEIKLLTRTGSDSRFDNLKVMKKSEEATLKTLEMMCGVDFSAELKK